MSEALIQHIGKAIIGILLLCSSMDSLPVGRVNNTRFTSVDHLNTDSIWLSGFTTWSQCVCAVLSGDFSSTAIALNMYRNGSCQLFITLPMTYTMEINNNSTLILLKQLPAQNLAPCCSDLSWLINKMNISRQPSANITRPSFVIIDDNNFLVALTYKGSLVQFNRTTLKLIQNKSIGTSDTSLSYRNGLYYIPDCPSGVSCVLNIVSTKNLSVLASIPLNSTLVREITLVRNDSLMLVAANNENQILFLDGNSPYNYTPSTTPPKSVIRPCGLNAINDTFIYIAPWYSPLSPTPVSTLQYSNNTWSLSSLNNTTPMSGEKIFQTTVDSCGRLWLAVNGYGIRIFDRWGYSLLYQWPVASDVDGFLLTDNYELFVTKFSAGYILHFNPNITQCTS